MVGFVRPASLFSGMHSLSTRMRPSWLIRRDKRGGRGLGFRTKAGEKKKKGATWSSFHVGGGFITEDPSAPIWLSELIFTLPAALYVPCATSEPHSHNWGNNYHLMEHIHVPRTSAYCEVCVLVAKSKYLFTSSIGQNVRAWFKQICARYRDST